MDASYFLHEMRWFEVQPYMDGMMRRSRSVMETLRLGFYFIVSMFSGKKGNLGKPSDMIPFAWDIDREEDEDPQMTDAEYEAKMKALLADTPKGWTK